MSMRPCPRLLAAAIPAMCLAIVALSAEPILPNPDSNRSQARSAEIKTAIRAKLPKFQPSSQQGDVTMRVGEGEGVEKEGVLNLPKVTVEGKKIDLTEYDMLTPKGRLELAMKARPGLGIGNLFGLNHGIAMAMEAEVQEVRTKSALYQRVERVLLDDSADSRETRSMIESALGRANADWLKNSRDR